MVLAGRQEADTIAPDLLATLARACRDAERVRFDYRSRDGKESRRHTEPYRLVSAGRRWYRWPTISSVRLGAPSAISPIIAPQVLDDGKTLGDGVAISPPPSLVNFAAGAHGNPQVAAVLRKCSSTGRLKSAHSAILSRCQFPKTTALTVRSRLHRHVIHGADTAGAQDS